MTRTPVRSLWVDPLEDGMSGIRLLDMMGDDWTPVEAARISYDQGLKGEAADTKLTTYLLKNRHTTPFEMVDMVWEVKLPIFVARQWVRHRTASINEESKRYTEAKDEFWVPKKLRAQDTKNRQGSEGVVSDLHQVLAVGMIEEHNKAAYDLYKYLLDIGTSREMARTVLPLSTYTHWIWKNDLHNTLHFLDLRTDPHAQEEIRLFAEVMVTIMTERLPVIMGVWNDLRGNPV